MKEIYQYTLVRPGHLRMTCWLDMKLKVGHQVTLKGESKDEWWTIESMHGVSNLEILNSHRKWNNNI